MAEYFGESYFTGDGYISGLIPPWRLARLKAEIADGKLKHLEDLMHVSAKQWNAELSPLNYDQAWSLVQFFDSPQASRYHRAFAQFLKRISTGESAETACASEFPDPATLEIDWRRYWLGLDENPTRDGYARAAVSTLTGVLRRSYIAGQRFVDFADFARAIADGDLRSPAGNTFPPELARQALMLSRQVGGTWSIAASPGPLPHLLAHFPDGKAIDGSFSLEAGHIGPVSVQAN